MRWEIVPLPRAQYKDYAIAFEYTTDGYYDIRIDQLADGDNLCVSLVRQSFGSPVQKRFVDLLYEDHWDAPQAYGMLDAAGTPVAVLELSFEGWNRRLRITNIWVERGRRRQGLGRALMEHAKAAAASTDARAIILETQSCNIDAIAFYRAQGFCLAGLDAYAYGNDDIQKKEVRLEWTFLLE